MPTMVKVAAIFAAFALALAPGMDASRLLHAAELCHFFGHTHHGHDHHEHDDAPGPHDEVPGECPHDHCIPVETGAMITLTSAADIDGTPTLFHDLYFRPTPRAAKTAPPTHPGRPPPDLLTNRLLV